MPKEIGKKTKIELCYNSQFTKKMVRTKTLSEIYKLPIIKAHILSPDKNIMCVETLIGKKYYISIYEYTEKIEEHFWNRFRIPLIAHRLSSTRKYICYNELSDPQKTAHEERIFTIFTDGVTRQIAIIKFANKFYKHRNVNYHNS